MKKISEFDEAGTLTMEDLIMISQLVDESKYKSFKVTLDLLKKFLGEVTVVDVGVNLNTLTEPGFYILQGADTMQNSYNLNYPSGLAPGSRVLMSVSAELAPWAMIVQTYFYAKLTSNPCPYCRGKSGGGAWAGWTQPLSSDDFSKQGMKQINMSQNDAELHTVGNSGPSNVWVFNAPNDDSSTPLLNTSPTLKAGVKLNLAIPNARPIIGTYKGNTFIADQDGRFFGNVDTTQVSDKENPKGVNWREYLSVKMTELKSIADCDINEQYSVVYAVNSILSLLRGINALSKDAPKFISAEEKVLPDRPSSVPVNSTEGLVIYITPPDYPGHVYARLAGTAEGTISGGDDKGDYLELSKQGMEPKDDEQGGEIKGYCNMEWTATGPGELIIEVSDTPDFAVIRMTSKTTITS